MDVFRQNYVKILVFILHGESTYLLEVDNDFLKADT